MYPIVYFILGLLFGAIPVFMYYECVIDTFLLEKQEAIKHLKQHYRYLDNHFDTISNRIDIISDYNEPFHQN